MHLKRSNQNNIGREVIRVMLFLFMFFNIGKEAFSQYSSQTASLDSIREAAIEVLKKNLQDLSYWDKVHAAEYLLWTGHNENIREIFLEQNRNFGDKSEYRIGIWRVLAE